MDYDLNRVLHQTKEREHRIISGHDRECLVLAVMADVLDDSLQVEHHKLCDPKQDNARGLAIRTHGRLIDPLGFHKRRLLKR